MVSFYVMSDARHPFEANSDAALEQRIRDDAVEQRITNGQPDLSSVTDLIAHDLVEKMLEDTPANRPVADKLLEYSQHALLSAIYLPCTALALWPL